MCVIVHPNFSGHAIRYWSVLIFVKVSTILGNQNHVIVKNEVINVVYDSVGTTIWIGSSHVCSLRFIQRYASIIKTIHYALQSHRMPFSIKSWKASLARQDFLHHSLLDGSLLGDQRVQRFEQVVYIGQRLGDCALFSDWWNR